MRPCLRPDAAALAWAAGHRHRGTVPLGTVPWDGGHRGTVPFGGQSPGTVGNCPLGRWGGPLGRWGQSPGTVGTVPFLGTVPFASPFPAEAGTGRATAAWCRARRRRPRGGP